MNEVLETPQIPVLVIPTPAVMAAVVEHKHEVAERRIRAERQVHQVELARAAGNYTLARELNSHR